MDDVGKRFALWPARAAVFGASGGIGRALLKALIERGSQVYAGSRKGDAPGGIGVTPFAFDLENEATIAAAATAMCDFKPQLVVVATGVLTLPDGSKPERSYRKLDAETMARMLAINTVGPALIAKHMLPLLPRGERCVFAALSARVGSIGDNRSGGWHSYRASKAALNMLLTNFAIELGRTHQHSVVCGLHPGTVDTALSKPFQGGVPEGKLFSPAQSAGYLLNVIDGLGPGDSGGVFDWAAERVPN